MLGLFDDDQLGPILLRRLSALVRCIHHPRTLLECLPRIASTPRHGLATLEDAIHVCSAWVMTVRLNRAVAFGMLRASAPRGLLCLPWAELLRGRF